MLLLNRYTYDPSTDFLADGGSARVYKAVDSQRDNLQVVIKFYYHTTTATFKSNMERIKTLQHPNLVALYDYTELDMVNAFGQTDTLRIGIWEYVNCRHRTSSKRTARCPAIPTPTRLCPPRFSTTKHIALQPSTSETEQL